ncbi:serine/threonine protein kinase [Candidatus Uabimicrobium sp. HlEnr_7]|uniref:serine/threonine protein kinase n=1 Tax=Candidatus Uabimicrobium helgolandensis TaxID=3095367 RepID=UPI0035569E7B
MDTPLFEINDGHELKIVRKIASGGMGTVYEAIQIGARDFKKRMAIKTLMEDAAEDKEFVDMFISEAKLVADLIHENITQVYQLGKFQNSFYIAMEYINGVNLQDFQERHTAIQEVTPEDISAFLISRVCRALEYAHNKRDSEGDLLNIVHRDVSPKNIMISFEGIVKLTDFGIAKAVHHMDKEGDVLYGKVPYMSPEQASFKVTDSRSDIFSLGICFYELLSGEILFGNQETIITMQKIMREDVPPIREKCPNISEKLERIIHKALDRDLEKRYQTAGEMGTDLEHFLYDDGYGPTNLTLKKYVKNMFPERVPQYK